MERSKVVRILYVWFHSSVPRRDNTEFAGITKMPIGVKLFNLITDHGMRGNGTVSGLMRVVTIIKIHDFCISFELFDNPVCVFLIVFGYSGFNARRIFVFDFWQGAGRRFQMVKRVCFTGMLDVAV